MPTVKEQHPTTRESTNALAALKMHTKEIKTKKSQQDQPGKKSTKREESIKWDSKTLWEEKRLTFLLNTTNLWTTWENDMQNIIKTFEDRQQEFKNLKEQQKSEAPLKGKGKMKPSRPPKTYEEIVVADFLYQNQARAATRELKKISDKKQTLKEISSPSKTGYPDRVPKALHANPLPPCTMPLVQIDNKKEGPIELIDSKRQYSEEEKERLKMWKTLQKAWEIKIQKNNSSPETEKIEDLTEKNWRETLQKAWETTINSSPETERDLTEKNLTEKNWRETLQKAWETTINSSPETERDLTEKNLTEQNWRETLQKAWETTINSSPETERDLKEQNWKKWKKKPKEEKEKILIDRITEDGSLLHLAVEQSIGEKAQKTSDKKSQKILQQLKMGLTNLFNKLFFRKKSTLQAPHEQAYLPNSHQPFP